ncbi:MAG: hypothetical protein H7841_13060 [Magnetospirillum sp. WYHS-4]
MARNTKALVTLLIGEPAYREEWERQVEPTWRQYAARHGYDIVAIDRHIDDSPRGRERARNWQKCLILEHPDVQPYDDVVWLDADILINFLAAPCIVEANARRGVGLVSYGTLYDTPHIHAALVERQARLGDPEATIPTIADIYRAAGLSPAPTLANTGVMVLYRPRHAAALRHVYDTYEENPRTAKEEFPLCHYLYGNGLAADLDRRFNWPWLYHVIERYPFLLNDAYRNDRRLVALCVNSAWANSWFLHFTGDQPATRHHAVLVMTWAALGDAVRKIIDNLG